MNIQKIKIDLLWLSDSIDLSAENRARIESGVIGIEQQQAEIEKRDDIIREMIVQLWKTDFNQRDLKMTEQPRSIQVACELLNIKR